MNTTASFTFQLLMLIITVAFTSALILSLVQLGLITVRADGNAEEVPILNAEFLPVGREGTLAVKEFQFCRFVDEQYNCLDPKENFVLGEEVHFRFVVETSTFNGEVMLVENYRLLDPQGKVILDVDEKNNFHFDITSKEKKELITFKDYFIAGYELVEGPYTLELHLENPLMGKNIKVNKQVGIYSYPR